MLVYRLWDCPNIDPTVREHPFFLLDNNPSSNSRRWRKSGLKLAHRLRRWPSISSIGSSIPELRRWPNIKPALHQRLVFSGKTEISPGNQGRWLNAGLMLGQRRRRWLSINPALGQRLVFYWLLQQMGTCSPGKSPHIQLSLVFSAPRPDCS